MSDIQAAINFLRAEVTEDGTYTYRADGINVDIAGVTEEDMYDLAARLEAMPDDKWQAYSRWCVESSSIVRAALVKAFGS
jgi:hypothetical protein